MEQLQQIVTQEVKDRLPEFTLTPRFLGVGNIQDITQETLGQNDSKQYRVFGIEPVNQTINICFDGCCYEMSIGSYV